MQRKAIAARWFEVTIYHLKRSEDPSVGPERHKNTIGFSSTQALARQKARKNDLSKDLAEVRWYHLENLPPDAPDVFFVIHPRTILLDQNRKTFGRVVSNQEARIDPKEKRKRKTTR